MCIVVCISTWPKSQSFPRLRPSCGSVRPPTCGDVVPSCAQKTSEPQMKWAEAKKSNLGNAMHRSTSSINGFSFVLGVPQVRWML